MRTNLFCFIALAISLVACNHVPNNKKDGTTVQPPEETAVVEVALIDSDNDGIDDKTEVDMCGFAAAQDPDIRPAGFAKEDVFDAEGNLVFAKGAAVPAAPELCDGLNNDCDQICDANGNNCQPLIDEGLDPDGNFVGGEIVYNLDGDAHADCMDQDLDGDGVPNVDDCAPEDENVKPGATEVCGDDVDNDCDGDTDEEDALNCTPHYLDSDGDTYGSLIMAPKCLCAPIQDYSTTKAGDCDDGDINAFPGAPELCDGKDQNCNGDLDDESSDNEGDGVADCVDPDDDNDGVADTSDNCPLVANAEQADNDADLIGDACDPDDDNDGVADTSDNCQFVANADQTDTDLDGQGNACDSDADNDGVENSAPDNCLLTPNADQADTDNDGQGNACDSDDDADNILDEDDNCPLVANADQVNTDGDTQGNACDSDDDNDSILDDQDNCPLVANADQADTDGDGVGDACVDDIDGDGDPDQTDCQPTNPSIFTGAFEDCDGIDNNCDGQTDEGYPNLDGDEFADCLDQDTDNDGDPNGTDCAPNDPTIHNNVVNDECDGVDNDCDGQVDENPTLGGSPGVADQFFKDLDQDGFGQTLDFKVMCQPSVPWTALQGGDCMDTIETINPGAEDVCGNGIDEDCSGSDAVCSCTPDCNGKVCGDNGCGGFCQPGCGADSVCSDDQTECVPLVESGECTNGTDDDNDGATDCDDTDCVDDPACITNCVDDADCDDSDPCTENTCSDGACLANNTTATCDDGEPCTIGDACLNGNCAGTTDSCDDGNPCTVDSCELGTGCVHTPSSAPECTPCTTNSDCAASEACYDGLCYADTKGETPDGAAGDDGGVQADGTADNVDDDGDGYCEVAPCIASADPSRNVADLLGGDCDDDPGPEGQQVAFPCADPSLCAGGTFPSDGSWGNNPGATDWTTDTFDNDCTGGPAL